MTRTQPSRSSPLWVLTTYFSFAHSQRRLANYHAFRARLGAPLLTVEVSTSGEFALQRTDAEILVQCARGSVLWQKERLLNHGLQFLPRDCRYVAWVDCDVWFSDPDWPEQTIAALESWPLVQMYRYVVYAPPAPQPTSFGAGTDWARQPGIAHGVADGKTFQDCIQTVLLRQPGTPSTGMAWAARREWMATHGWFDAAIIGGGDTALVGAAYGQPEIVAALHHMNAHQRAVYYPWAAQFHRGTRGRVAHLLGTLLHLWHGDLRDRQPGQRHVGLEPFAFDPLRDLVIAPSGAWRWATDKPDLHAYLMRYFASRREDGRTASSV